MSFHRFFVRKESIFKKKVFLNQPEQVHQIRNVLRLKIGEKIVVLDNSGFEYQVILEKIDQAIEGQIVKKQKNKNEPKIKIILLQALLKHDRFEQVLKFGTSLGLNTFIPLITERSIIRKLSPHKLIRYQKIIKESAEQSGRGILPPLENLMFFDEALNFLKNKPGLKLIAWENERKRKLSFFESKIRKIKEVYLCIGPEGGFSDQEICLARKYGFSSFSLGRLILRAEIAGLIASSLIFSYNKII